MTFEVMYKLLGELYKLRDEIDGTIEIIGSQNFSGALMTELQSLRGELEEMDTALSERIVFVLECMLKDEKTLEEWSS